MTQKEDLPGSMQQEETPRESKATSQECTAKSQEAGPNKDSNFSNKGNLDMSPSKSKNKKRNDAKRRNNSSKKQTLKSNTTRANHGDTSHLKQPNDELQGEPEISSYICIPPQEENLIKENNPSTSEPADKDAPHRVKEDDELKQCESYNAKLKDLEDKLATQEAKSRELEVALLNTTKSRNLLERLLQQELADRTRLETEITNLEQTNSRLKSNIQVLEKSKSNTDEILRVLNATLMERETEVSILKLKLTRLQAKPVATNVLSSTTSVSSVKQDPAQAFIAAGRSNSEFNRNSYGRSSMMAEVVTRSSMNQLKGSDRDAVIWATVPEELTPSKRPSLLNRNFDMGYTDSSQNSYYGNSNFHSEQSSTPLSRDRRYQTLPRSLKNPHDESSSKNSSALQSDTRPPVCQVTNLDDSNTSSQSGGNKTPNSSCDVQQPSQGDNVVDGKSESLLSEHQSKNSAAILPPVTSSVPQVERNPVLMLDQSKVSDRTPSSPMRLSSGIRKIFDRFRRSDSSHSHSKMDVESPSTSPFKRGGNRTTLIGTPGDLKSANNLVKQAINFQTDKPFAEWNTEMIEKWLTMIGLSMYSAQCKRWFECGAQIMNATPAEVDKWLGITNHLHSKKLRLAISELNGDCDKVTKAAAKLDYLWVARWLDDIGLPQHKEAFINARVDGRVLNYLTVEDLLSLNVKSLLHHTSIKCGIRVLRSINFELQHLKRRATSEEIESMISRRQNMSIIGDHPDKKDNMKISRSVLPLWTCHRVMEWLRMIDFAEFASNLRGSGVHGGLLVYEPGFDIDTMCALLSIPTSRTLLRRHLSTFFNELIGEELSAEKVQFKENPTSVQLNPTAEFKNTKKTTLWKLKSSKVTQDIADEYLCPMYSMDPSLVATTAIKSDNLRSRSDVQTLALIPESINV